MREGGRRGGLPRRKNAKTESFFLFFFYSAFQKVELLEGFLFPTLLTAKSGFYTEWRLSF